MEQTLIAHITPTISLLADDYQYILIFRANPTQALKNGRHIYHSTMRDCFEEILTSVTKTNLANGEDKTMKEIANIMENTIQEIRQLLKPFEELNDSPKG